ncbi:hypothetical protein Ancab_011002 [Ancistrocladus abbreviatus]
MNASDLQIWDNAAFDNGESEDHFLWSTKKPSFLNPSQSLQSDSPTKENTSPNTQSTRSSSRLTCKKDLSEIENHQNYYNRGYGKEILCAEGNDIDSEIVEIEREINRLSSRLEALKLEKANRSDKLMEKRGRIVPAKFMESKSSTKTSDGLNKIEESVTTASSKSKTVNRGVSLGPAEIIRGARRGISLGPAEIYSAVKSKESSNKQQLRMMMTPNQHVQSRRKSCFWKLEEIDEVTKVKKERGKSLSVSPKSHKPVSRLQASKQGAATTVGSKKFVKKEDGVISSIQPKNLFKVGEKSVPTKRLTPKTGRTVASRFNQSSGSSAVKDLRKRSLPENDKEDGKRSEKKRVSLDGKLNGAEKLNDNRVKKRWEVPNGPEMKKSVMDDNATPLSVTKMLDLVPKIRTTRCADESPRDSGAAKRVSELIGRRSYFSVDDDDNKKAEESVCQALSFAEGEVVQKDYPMIRTLHCINESPRDSGAAERVSEFIGRKSFFDDDDDNGDFGTSVFQALSFA